MITISDFNAENAEFYAEDAEDGEAGFTGLISADLYIFSFLLVPDIGVQCRTSQACTGTDKCAFASTDQAAEECSRSGPNGQVDAVTMAAIITGLLYANVFHTPVTVYLFNVIV